MIYEFTIENFRSFGQAQTLNLIKGKEQKKPDNLISGPDGFPKVVKTAAIFGHNASGKSNLFRAVATFIQAVQFSTIGLNPGSPIPGIEPHRLDPQWDGKPTRFEIVFPMGARVFRYGFSALPQAILDEHLEEELKSGNRRTLMRRHAKGADNAANVDFSGDEFDKAARENVPKLTRDNALVLSCGASLNVPLLRDIYSRIATGISCVQFSPFRMIPDPLAEEIQEDAEFRGMLSALLRDADIGIKGVRVGQPPEPTLTEIEQLQRQLAPQYGERAGAVASQLAAQRSPKTIVSEHERRDGSSVEFPWSDESQGTQLFAQLARIFRQAIRNRSTIFIDEFGANIHPLLSERLIELFQDSRNNPNDGAQLVFTTHHSQLMTPALFRKDQIWIVEKSSEGQTELFSLADFRADKYTRSSEPFEKHYLNGRYGGVGSFGPTLAGSPLCPAERPDNHRDQAGIGGGTTGESGSGP